MTHDQATAITVHIISHRTYAGYLARCLETGVEGDSLLEIGGKRVSESAAIRNCVEQLIAIVEQRGTLQLDLGRLPLDQIPDVAELAARACHGSVTRVTLRYIPPTKGTWSASY